MICLARMRRDRRTREYVARRTAEGKSKREIIRCLKRYVAREAYRVLVSLLRRLFLAEEAIRRGPRRRWERRRLTIGPSVSSHGLRSTLRIRDERLEHRVRNTPL